MRDLQDAIYGHNPRVWTHTWLDDNIDQNVEWHTGAGSSLRHCFLHQDVIDIRYEMRDALVDDVIELRRCP